MRVCIFYNGTDSSFEKDANLESGQSNRFQAGEIISRLSHAVNCKESHVLQVNGVSGDSRYFGTVLGVGLEQNVQFGKDFWVHRMTQSTDISNELIICGWSRGGITAMCLARAVSDYLNDKQVAINSWKIKVMTFDPVAGKGCNWEGTARKKWYILAPIVKEYVGFYAREELSPGFETTIPSRESEETKMTLIDVAGFHSSLVGSITETKNGNDDWAARVYGVVKNRALQALGEWGVLFNDTFLDKWEDDIVKLSRQKVGTSNEFRDRCASHDITYSILRGSNLYNCVEGRGVFVGDNATSRQWIRTKTLEEFLKTDNHVTNIDGVKGLPSKMPFFGSYMTRAPELIIHKISPVSESISFEIIDGV
jgi:hypothetical protein